MRFDHVTGDLEPLHSCNFYSDSTPIHFIHDKYPIMCYWSGQKGNPTSFKEVLYEFAEQLVIMQTRWWRVKKSIESSEGILK